MRSAQGRDETQAVVQRITGELADLAALAAADAEKMLVNGRRALRRAQDQARELAAAGGADPVAGRRRGRLHRAVNDLAELLDATRRIAAQTLTSTTTAFRGTVKRRTGVPVPQITTTNRDADGTAPGIEPEKEPGPGPDTGSWSTTWSKSPPRPQERESKINNSADPLIVITGKATPARRFP